MQLLSRAALGSGLWFSLCCAAHPPSSIAASYARAPDSMHLVRLQRPAQRAAASSCRPLGAALRTVTTSFEERFAHLRIGSPAANAVVQGRRYASVKSQGAYRLKNKKTIPKKLGAKKTGGMASDWRPCHPLRSAAAE